jgi:hypothetical protein
MPPNAFHRIEFRRIRRQEGQQDTATLCRQVLPDLSALVSTNAVSNNKQRLADLPFHSGEERDHAFADDCPCNRWNQLPILLLLLARAGPIRRQRKQT